MATMKKSPTRKQPVNSNPAAGSKSTEAAA